MDTTIRIDEIIEYVTVHYSGMTVNTNWGERGLFYNPDRLLPKGIYLMTFKEKDGQNDSASNINRGGMYRLNLGVAKNTFLQLFGSIPARPAAGQIVQTGHDFQEINRITPHPVYGWMAWIAVLNPTHETFDSLKPMIDEAYQLAAKKWKARVKAGKPAVT